MLSRFHHVVGGRSRRWTLSLVLGAIFAVLVETTSADAPRSRQDRPRDESHFSAGVDWVVLHIVALDKQGRIVTGLHAEDFRVSEDGAPQPIALFREEDVPVTVGIVVDNSGSMKAERDQVIGAALAFARASNPGDEMFTVNFNERVWFGLPAGVPFTSDLTQLAAALSTMKADGMTALYDAVAAALDHLRNGTRDKRALILVSDGGDTASNRTFDDIARLATTEDAAIYAVGFFAPNRADSNPRVLEKLARLTGGEAFFPRKGTDLAPTCRRIAHALRKEYTVGYAPTNTARDGTYRRIRVTAAAAGRGHIAVRTRAGYIAPSQAPGVSRPECATPADRLERTEAARTHWARLRSRLNR